MGKPLKYSKNTVLEAIKGSGGIVTTVSKRLGCEWITAKRYIEKFEETKRAMLDEEETILDMAEGAVFKSIQEGNTQDAKWLLSTKGKERGFSERLEKTIRGDKDAPLGIAVNVNFDTED